jgi:hypothetical protein
MSIRLMGLATAHYEYFDSPNTFTLRAIIRALVCGVGFFVFEIHILIFFVGKARNTLRSQVCCEGQGFRLRLQ